MKIFGFRSNKLWKKIVASTFYAFVFFIAIIIVIAETTSDEPVSEDEPVVENESVVEDESIEPVAENESIEPVVENESIETSDEPVAENESVEEISTKSSNDEFKQQIMIHGYSTGATLEELGNLLSYPDISNNEWKIKVVKQLLTLQSLVEQAKELTFPAEYKEFGNYYMLTMDELSIVVKELPEAIDNLDIKKMESVNAHMQQAAQYLNLANAYIN